MDADAYRFACTRCGLDAESPDRSEPDTGRCPRSASGLHRLRMLAPVRHSALHESAHAVAAAVVGGAGSVRSVVVDRWSGRTVTDDLPRIADAVVRAAGRYGGEIDGTTRDESHDDRSQRDADVVIACATDHGAHEARAALGPAAYKQALGAVIDAVTREVDSAAADVVRVFGPEIATLAEAVTGRYPRGLRGRRARLEIAVLDLDGGREVVGRVLDSDYVTRMWRSALRAQAQSCAERPGRSCSWRESSGGREP